VDRASSTPIASRHPAVGGFHTDDGDNYFRRHAEFALCTLQCRAVLVKKLHALVLSLLVEKYRPVGIPRLGFLGGPGDRFQDTFLALGLGKYLQQLLAVKSLFRHQFIHQRARSGLTP
jgi:hypothetical protein